VNPGDIAIARAPIRAWETDTERGTRGPWIREGTVVSVVEAWAVGGQARFRVLLHDRLAVVSHPCHAVNVAWRVVGNHGTGSLAAPGSFRGPESADT